MPAHPWLRIERGERYAFALSFLYFTALLACYYLIRPVRDALGAGLGPSAIKYLSTAVFVVMLAVVPVFGWLVSRYRRAVLVPAVYAFFVANLLLFALLFRVAPDAPWLARTFYVWTTVFNLFVVSVFWSFMADIWREEQGRRLFGMIAAGGSLGGIVGPVVAHALVDDVGLAGLALIAAGFLACTLLAIVLLSRHVGESRALAPVRLQEPVGGELWAGVLRLARSPFLLGIAGLVVGGSLLGMVVYIELAAFVNAAFATAAERTAFYSQRDFYVNVAALVFQFALVGRLTTWFGVRTTLVLTAALAVVAFSAVGLAPTLGVLVVANVLMRATELGLAKPGRDMLYTVVEPETKYKVKNLVDTAVYRFGDMTSGWTHDALAGVGVTLVGFAWLAAVLATGLAALSYAVGTGYRSRGGV